MAFLSGRFLRQTIVDAFRPEGLFATARIGAGTRLSLCHASQRRLLPKSVLLSVSVSVVRWDRLRLGVARRKKALYERHSSVLEENICLGELDRIGVGCCNAVCH